ncbi:BatD family protein [Alteromonas sp. ASW11-19]|uniref:BatD family protein n=1 Tax=Alteromonas salexigens TaxID=2982530 RepID=A0ABT2VPC3_9ALTE|nr:BatD family protein [Alteromonas salexigens]MCU7555166.1 BatD family protein [Alteromonas salexigens]
MRTLVFILISVLGWHLPALAEVEAVEASVDNNPVMLDEAIRLTVTAHGDADRDAFDSSVLLDDFVVGRTSVSSRTSMVNFNTTRTTVWTTTLFPRAVGTFTIPAITIEGKQSAPIEIEVIPVAQGSTQATRDYFVTTQADTREVYLNQQILYTAKLHLATRIEQGSLQAPELANAEIRQVGEDKQYTDIVNGKRYQVIERNFAVVPQKSGTFTLRGPVFQGEVIAADSNQRFGFFNRTQQVNRVGADITIEVKPVPTDIDYHWLPSEFVGLDEEWPDQESFTVGEPMTRVLTFTAMGVVEEQLPELPSHYPPGFKLYPDQASTATVEKDNLLIAQRVESLAIIPTKAGDFVLPEVTVPWFNVLTGETEYATLPARTITVAPAAADTSAPPQTQPQSPAETPPASPLPGADSAPVRSPTYSFDLYLAGALAIALAGWLFTWLYYRRRTGTAPAPVGVNQPVSVNEKHAFSALLRAVDSGESANIQARLRDWLGTLLPHHRPAVVLSTHPTFSEVQQQLNQLLAARYGAQPQAWQASEMRSALERARNSLKRQQNSASSRLPDLYPDVK